jgi:hypothetical protein
VRHPSLKRLARRLARPALSPLDGRVADVNRRVADIDRRVADAQISVGSVGAEVNALTQKRAAYATTATESNSYVGVEMRRFREALDELTVRLDEQAEQTSALLDAIQSVGVRIDDARYVERLADAADAPLERIDGAVANLVNHAMGHRGFAAQAGLWFNPPVTVELGEGRAHLASVNERIVEVPFAMSALSRLPPSAKILDVGSAESTFALSAASLGFDVTAVDLHPLPYSHPNLRRIMGRFEDWDPGSERFDAAFLISTIEHFGLGAYGEATARADADRAALARIGRLLGTEGFVVLTAPYGTADVDELERTYDESGLTALLDGWTVTEKRTFWRTDSKTWVPGANDHERVPDAGCKHGVVTLVATPNSSA